MSSTVNRESVDDLELAKRAGSGDESAFATLYDRHADHVYNYCYRLTSSEHDAADATQQAFLKMLEKLPSRAGELKNFQAYVLTIARNECYRGIEKTKRTRPVDDVTVVKTGGPSNDDEDRRTYEQPETAALIEDQQAQVRIANAKLPERQREVLALREVEGMSYGEIASLMELNENSVAQLISRARLNLRKELRTDALTSIATASKECAEVLPLIAMAEDRQKMSQQQRELVERHVKTCEYCAACSEAMEEAGVSYRAWVPIVPALVLRESTLAKATEILDGYTENSQGSGSVASEAADEAGFFTRNRRHILGSSAVVAVVAAVVIASSLSDGENNRFNGSTQTVNNVAVKAAPTTTQKSTESETKTVSVETVTTNGTVETITHATEQVASNGKNERKQTDSKRVETDKPTTKKKSTTKTPVKKTPVTTTPAAPAPAPVATTPPAVTTPPVTETTSAAPPPTTSAPPTTTATPPATPPIWCTGPDTPGCEEYF